MGTRQEWQEGKTWICSIFPATPEKTMALTADNYSKGFLVDEELMGGVTSSSDRPGEFLAYVMNHLTGEYLGYQGFASLEQALDAVNQVQRSWVFESVSGCSSGKCAGENCKVGGCGKKLSALAPCSSGCPT